MSFFSKLFSSKPTETKVEIQPEAVTTDVLSTEEEQILLTKPLSLIKTCADQNPKLVDLAKKASVSLIKKDLTDIKANVIVVLDASGSMYHQYRKGHVQQVLDRLVPLATHFDSDGVLDCWAFASNFKCLTPITLKNVNGYLTSEGLKTDGSNIGIGCSNNEPLVITDVIDTYLKSGTTLPTYVIFITDGGIGSQTSQQIESQLKEASKLGIFWQFVGIGGSNYGILERLDDMPGRIVDNCDFFSISSLDSVTTTELYDSLLNEFPQWLKDAKSKGVIL